MSYTSFAAHPKRLDGLIKALFPSRYYIWPVESKRINYDNVRRCTTIKVFLDEQALQEGKSIGTKLELQYAVNHNKLEFLVIFTGGTSFRFYTKIAEIFAIIHKYKLFDNLPKYNEYMIA